MKVRTTTLTLAIAAGLATIYGFSQTSQEPLNPSNSAVNTQLKAANSENTKAMNDQFVKPSDQDLRVMLSPMQYKVTQKEGTEPPFNNAYWDEKRPGIYVDVVSGEPLFSSTHKYKSGTGWPSFYQPLVEANIVSKTDYHLLFPRTEVRSKHANSHLGHVFKDGPQPTGLRYCINSAALRFIPVENLEQEGYAKFISLFEY